MLKDISTTIVWHDATKELPKRGGYYLVATRHKNPEIPGHITALHYSAKHQLFNCYDPRFDDEETDISNAFDPECIVAWAEHLPLYEEIYNAFNEGVTKFDRIFY